MKNSRIRILIVLGAVLILASFSVLFAFQLRMLKGTQKSQDVVLKMTQLLPQRTPGVPGLYPETSMPVLEIDGTDYVSLLEIPAYGITLPVANEWNRGKIFQSPARFFGSAYDQMLIVGGVDSPGQFGFCDKIDQGDLITVTDMTGAQFSYTVSTVDRAKRAETQWLLNEAYHLTLFCTDAFSMEYIAVRCTLAYN